MKKHKVLIISICLLLSAAGTAVLLLLNGIIWFNNPDKKNYPIRGVDVSAYQGKIDWNAFAQQNIDFAYIKATEGSSAVDAYFETNLKNAGKTNIKIGAYHFFSFDSNGESQARNFIHNVSVKSFSLPPAVDFEFYGSYKQNHPSKSVAVHNMKELLTLLENHYHQKPVIYVNTDTYNEYLTDGFEYYPIWIRDIIKTPAPLKNNTSTKTWTFWQYSDHGRLYGFNGKERFIDLDVYNGTEKEFLQFIIYNNNKMPPV